MDQRNGLLAQFLQLQKVSMVPPRSSLPLIFPHLRARAGARGETFWVAACKVDTAAPFCFVSGTSSRYIDGSNDRLTGLERNHHQKPEQHSRARVESTDMRNAMDHHRQISGRQLWCGPRSPGAILLSSKMSFKFTRSSCVATYRSMVCPRSLPRVFGGSDTLQSSH